MSYSWGAVVGPWPGRAAEQPDVPIGETGGRTWVLGVDPAAWPLNQGDIVIDADSAEQWFVTSADLLANNADPTVDYIRVEAHTRAAAGTKP